VTSANNRAEPPEKALVGIKCIFTSQQRTLKILETSVILVNRTAEMTSNKVQVINMNTILFLFL